MTSITGSASPMIIVETVARRILLVRGTKGMLNAGLAEPYDLMTQCSTRMCGQTSGVIRHLMVPSQKRQHRPRRFVLQEETSKRPKK